MNDTIGFIGFGLIGGSIARSLKQISSDIKIIAFNYYKEKSNLNLIQALEDHVIDKIETVLSHFSECNIIFLCAPVLTNISYLNELKSIIKSSCILTDVGSVKGNIHQAIKELNLEANFIGGHPMTGSEKTGYQHSSSRLLENAYYILTSTPKTPSDRLEKLRLLVEKMGAIPVILKSEEHDDITAAISHVPHIIAASLVNLVKTYDSENKMRVLAAGGFKDITRIASSSPIMWQNICLTNDQSILKFLTYYRNSINDILSALSQKEEKVLYQIFESAKEYRDSIPNQSLGFLEKMFEVYVDIIDEAGAIATVATILASNTISIKNIGILHNREFEQGILHIEFYNQDAVDQAIILLQQYKYTIYER